MGITSVGPASEEVVDWDVTDEEVNQPNEPLKGSTPRLDPDSGVGKARKDWKC